MLVRMRQDATGSPDGVNVARYEKGKVVDVPTRLGEIFVQQGLAGRVDLVSDDSGSRYIDEPTEAPAAPGPSETKVVTPEATKANGNADPKADAKKGDGG